MQKSWSFFFSACDPWTGSTIWIRMVGAPAAAAFPWTNNLYCSVWYRHLLCLHACSVAKVSSSLLLVRCTLAAIAGQLTAQRSDSAAGSPFLQVRVSFTSFTLQKAIIFLSPSSRAASCMQVLRILILYCWKQVYYVLVTMQLQLQGQQKSHSNVISVPSLCMHVMCPWLGCWKSGGNRKQLAK